MLGGGSTDVEWKVVTDYAYGGYAKRNDIVTAFMRTFRERLNIPLDFVYTGKMMCAVFDLIEKGFFERGTTVLAIHTGGLQGGVIEERQITFDKWLWASDSYTNMKTAATSVMAMMNHL